MERSLVRLCSAKNELLNTQTCKVFFHLTLNSLLQGSLDLRILLHQFSEDIVSEYCCFIANDEQQTLGLQDSCIVRLCNQVEGNDVLNSDTLD